MWEAISIQTNTKSKLISNLIIKANLISKTKFHFQRDSQASNQYKNSNNSNLQGDFNERIWRRRATTLDFSDTKKKTIEEEREAANKNRARMGCLVVPKPLSLAPVLWFYFLFHLFLLVFFLESFLKASNGGALRAMYLQPCTFMYISLFTAMYFIIFATK